jgi:hypothetical protein
MAEDSLSPLSDEGTVFRLVPLVDNYYDAGKDKPHPKAFELSSDDKKQSPPRLSVFDFSRTTLGQTDSGARVTFNIEKSPHHRVVHVDGAFGGPTPHGLFHIAFYNDRVPIPKSITHKVTAEGNLGEEVERVGREGVFREIEVSAVSCQLTL